MTSTEIVDKLESMTLKDVPHEIVIKPVEIDHHNRINRDSVVLACRNGQDIRPKLGIYSIKGQYLRPTTVNKWVMVFLFDKQAVEDLSSCKYTFDDIKNFAEYYIKYGRSKGVTISPITSIQCVPAHATTEKNVDTMSSQDLKEEIRKLFIKLNENLVDHAIIIMPDNAPLWLHSYLQYLETYRWESDNGISSSSSVKLMKTSRIRLETLVNLAIRSECGGKRSLIPHIWLKYNTKLGGLNICLKRTFDTHELKFLNDGHLIISIDLCQQDQQSESPLVAVAVGMWDLASAHMSFHTQTRVQAKRDGDPIDSMAVKDLYQMVGEIIAAYKKRKDNQLPTRLIVFRVGYYKKADDEIIKQEIACIKKALDDAHKLAEAVSSGEQLVDPVLTYLKVPKKKATRKHNQDVVKTSSRPRAPTGALKTGSVVDSIISSQTEVPEMKKEPAMEKELEVKKDHEIKQEPEIKKEFEIEKEPEIKREPKEVPAVKTEFPPVIKRKPNSQQYPSDRPRSCLHKLYDEINMSNGAIQSMICALSYLSPRVAAMTRPTPIDLADLAGERTHNIVMAWMEDNKIKPEDPEFLQKVNRFLAKEMGDDTYKDHLYYA